MNKKHLLLAAVLLAGCSFSPLDKQLLSERPKTRERAFKKLLGLSPERRQEVIQPLIKALANEDNRVANRAAEALTRIGEPAVDPVIQTLGSDDPFLRIIACTVLGDIAARPGDVLPELAARLDDNHPLVREEAAHAIGRFGMRAEPVTAALRRATDDPVPEVREAAENALHQIQNAATAAPAEPMM